MKNLLIITLALWLADFSHAETLREGMEARVLKESHLRAEPSPSAPSLGRLPSGSIVVLDGRQEAGFVGVNVELEDDSVRSGWIQRTVLAYDIPEKVTRETVDAQPVERPEQKEPKPEPMLRPGKRIRIPSDEALLLRRQSLFFYGLHLRGNYAFSQSATQNYRDFGGEIGFQFGMYAYQFLPLRVELGYGLIRGTSDDGVGLDLGFVQAAAHVTYLLGRVEFSLGLMYAYGASVINLSQDVNIAYPRDLSSPYGVAGLGYDISFNDLVSMKLRGFFRFSMIQIPLAVQVLGIELAIDLVG